MKLNKLLRYVEEDLKFLPFVKWDRYVDVWDQFGFFIVYGWINRKKDSYKDFIVLEYQAKKVGYTRVFVTSSKKYSKKINYLFGVDDKEHKDCERVENLFSDLKNVIKLKHE